MVVFCSGFDVAFTSEVLVVVCVVSVVGCSVDVVVVCVLSDVVVCVLSVVGCTVEDVV